jgi:hypothetical protein
MPSDSEPGSLNSIALILQVVVETASIPIDNQKLQKDACELRRNVLANPARYPQIARFLLEDPREKIPDSVPLEGSV